MNREASSRTQRDESATIHGAFSNNTCRNVSTKYLSRVFFFFFLCRALGKIVRSIGRDSSRSIGGLSSFDSFDEFSRNQKTGDRWEIINKLRGRDMLADYFRQVTRESVRSRLGYLVW